MVCVYLLISPASFKREWLWTVHFISEFSSVQDGIYAIGKAHKMMRSIPSLASFLNVAFNTVPVFVWLTMALSRPFKEDRLALPLSTPLCSMRSMVLCPVCFVPAGSVCLKLLNTADLPRSKPLLRVALPASVSTRWFPFTPACPGQYTHRVSTYRSDSAKQ